MRIVLAMMLLACGCSSRSRADDLEAEYRIVSESGTKGEQCDKAKEVRDSRLAAHDRQGYEEWSLTAAVDCRSADQNGAAAPARD